MKKRNLNAQTASDIILADKESEVLIRQLVRKVHEKGICMSSLNSAITKVWKEEFPVIKEEYRLTVEQKAFAEKLRIS